MKIDQSQLHPSHIMFIMSHNLLPDHESFVNLVLVFFDEESEELSSVFLLRHLEQISLLTFQLLSCLDFILKLLSSGFKSLIDLIEPDEVKASLHEHMSSSSLNL